MAWLSITLELEAAQAEVLAAFAPDFAIAVGATEEGWSLVEGRRK